MKLIRGKEIAGCLLLLATGAPALANPFYQLSLSAGNEDNVPRGFDSKHSLDSNFFGVEFIGGKLYQLGVNHSLTLAAQFNSTRLNELKGFDKFGAALSARYVYKFGFGAYAPRLGAAVSIGQEEFDGDARDKRLSGLELSFSKRLSSAWLFDAGLDFQSSESKSLPHHPGLTALGYNATFARPFDLYDYESSAIFMDLEYTLASGILLSGGYRFTDGQSVSSTRTPTVHLYKISEAVYVDPAFGGSWLAYRLKADSEQWSLGLSFPVEDDASIDFGYSWVEIDASSGNTYKNKLFTLSFVHNF